MEQHRVVATALLCAALGLPSAAWSDFEVTGPDGRRILIKDDGTWRYGDAAGEAQAIGKPTVAPAAVLTLERRSDAGPNCRFDFRLANDLAYEIWSIVPSFSAYRPDGVLYETRSAGFVSIKPGNSQTRSVTFQGITCKEIAHIRVTGGDRCEMGDLTRFSTETGACLARVRVIASDLVRFDK
jgi:hypothetical protein